MTRFSGKVLAVAVAALCGAAALAGEKVGVGGSSTQYEARTEHAVGDRLVPMALTGTALRKKVVFNVYTIGSYMQEGANIHSAEQLAAADCPKMLHLVMERDVGGKDMAEAFQAAIRANYPDSTFNAELNALGEMMRALSVQKGDHVFLTNIPGKGLYCDLVGKKAFMIENVAFSRAVWEIYLGKNNISDAIKKGLVSRL
jgi:hypothetical protein